MKYKFWLILAILVTAAFGACKGKGSAGNKETFDKDASYALGMNIGASIAADNIYPNLDEFLKGMKDSLSGGQTRFDNYEASEIFQNAYYNMMEKREADFLSENGKKSDVLTTPSGLQYEVLVQAAGQKPSASDTVQVHFEASFINGSVFDSSYQWGNPIDIPIDKVIPGWSEGLQLMTVGSTYKFYIPSELGYGREGVENMIPPFSTLVFEVELLEIL